LIHVQDLAGFSLLWPRASAGSRQPWVFTPHGVNDREVIHKARGDRARLATAPLRAAFIRSVERISRGRFDASIVINSYLFDPMPDLLKKPHHLIPNPVDEIFLTVPSSAPSKRDGYQLLYAGEVSARKNVLTLIHIMKALARRQVDAHLHVVGSLVDQNYLKQCTEAVESMKLRDAITFHGSIKPQELVSWMDRADALLLASKQETAPMVVAEAHCRGLPVAVPRAFGLVSMIVEGQNGIFLDGPSATDDAISVAELLSARLDRNAIRRAAVRTYELRNILDRTIEVYQETLGIRAGQRRPIVAHAVE
jgi:glycosyltransferase involved in cell wall biosynthesis